MGKKEIISIGGSFKGKEMIKIDFKGRPEE